MLSLFSLSLFGISIAAEESITFIFSPGGRRASPVSPPGIGIWQQQSILFSAFWIHSGFFLFYFIFYFFGLDFLRVAVSSRPRFCVCLCSYMMATLPGTVPRMVRPAPGQNYPRTGFPLEGKKNDQTCKTSELELIKIVGCSLCQLPPW